MPHDLMAALQAKGLHPVGVNEAYAAFARVLLAQRSNPDQAIVLVVVQPDRLSRQDEVFAGLDRFAPKVARWSFDPLASPPLQAARMRPQPVVARSRPIQTGPAEEKLGSSGATHAVQTPSAPPRPDVRSASGPMLRLAGLDGPVRSSRDQEQIGSLLTQEEMQALLADTPTDHDGNASRNGGSRGNAQP